MPTIAPLVISQYDSETYASIGPTEVLLQACTDITPADHKGVMLQDQGSGLVLDLGPRQAYKVYKHLEDSPCDACVGDLKDTRWGWNGLAQEHTLYGA